MKSYQILLIHSSYRHINHLLQKRQRKYSPTLQPKSFKPLEYIPTRRAMPFTWGGTFSDTMRIFGLVVLLCSSNAVAAANTDEDDGNCATECGLSTLLLVIFPLRY